MLSSYVKVSFCCTGESVLRIILVVAKYNCSRQSHSVTLVSRAFPDFRDVDQEQLALNYYMKQLTDPRISVAVHQRRPKNIAEAVSATVELQCYLVTSPVLHVPKRIEDETQTEMLIAIQKLLDRVEQLETSLKRCG